MSSRDAILRAVRRNKPADTPLPEIPAFPGPEGDRIDAFRAMIEEVGGQVVDARDEAPADALARRYPDARVVGSTAPEVPGTRDLAGVEDPHDLADLDLLVVRADLGVAENGAVWVPETAMGRRAAPFLTQHLAVLLDRRRIVPTMHEAYARVTIDAEGFGAFIAGPSKTADIEQSLVIGAHGPRSLTLVLE